MEMKTKKSLIAQNHRFSSCSASRNLKWACVLGLPRNVEKEIIRHVPLGIKKTNKARKY
jgi:hypothetical protein